MLLQDPKEVDGIKVFHDDVDDDHTDYNSQGLDDLFQAEERHFWFLARKEFILQKMRSVIPLSSRMIEIGAGTGNVSRYLKENGYSNIAVGEIHANGLRYAKSYGIEECHQFDLLRAPFDDEFDAVCMFDVLEHIEDDSRALENVNQMLRDSGMIVLTVPAHRWLWNRDDVIAGHKRRYTKRELVAKFEKAGFDIVIARYFFMSIVPLLWLRTLLKKDNGDAVKLEEYEISMDPGLSKTLLGVSRVENRINSFLPNLFGGSLLIIARRQ